MNNLTYFYIWYTHTYSNMNNKNKYCYNCKYFKKEMYHEQILSLILIDIDLGI